MRGLSRRLTWVGVCSLVLAVAGTGCGKDATEPPKGASVACKDAGDASKDLSDFLQDYPANLPAARVALANMQSSLTAAGHQAVGVPSSLFEAIQSAQSVVDDALEALDQNRPVDTGALRDAMDSIGNACSQALGG